MKKGLFLKPVKFNSFNRVKAVSIPHHMKNVIKSLLVIPLSFIAFLFISTPSAHAAFTTVDCTNAAHCTTLGIPQAECEGLEVLWDANGPSWTNNTNWDTLSDANTWYGVTTSGGRVTRIEIDDNNGIGDISSFNISDFNNLNRVYFYSNNFTGDLSGWDISGLTNLSRFQIDSNQFSGDLSGWDISGLTNLSRFYIYSNQFSGPTIDPNGYTGRYRIQLNNYVFSDIEPNLANILATNPIYSPQNAVDTVRSVIVVPGETITITPSVAVNPSGNDRYQWSKNGTEIPGATDRVYTKTGAVLGGDDGVYTYKITNVNTTARLNRLKLNSNPITVIVIANMIRRRVIIVK